jgi:hypothetical protein
MSVLQISGVRGKTFAQQARENGAYGAVSGDTDAQVLAKLLAAATPDVSGKADQVDLDAAVAAWPAAKVDAKDHGSDRFALAVVGASGQGVGIVTRDGFSPLAQTGEASIRSELYGDLPAQDALDLGARGTVLRARRDRKTGLTYYDSDVYGGRQRFLTRSDKAGRAHVLDSADVLTVHIGDGQSWETNPWEQVSRYAGDTDRERVLTLYYEGAGASPTEGPLGSGGGINIPGTVDDLIGFAATSNISISIAAMMAFQRYNQSAKAHVVPTIGLMKGYPGSNWWDPGDGIHYLGPGSTAWGNGFTGGTNLKALIEANVARYGKTVEYRCVSWTQGGQAAGTYNAVVYATDYDATLAALADMVSVYDALALAGTADRPLNFLISQVAAKSEWTTVSEAALAQLDFCRTNASGRAWMVTPWYQWAYGAATEGDPGDIHTDAVGTVRHGEWKGYVRHVVETLGLDWNPLWRSGVAITRQSAHVVRVPLARPSGPGFEWSSLALDTSLIELAPGWGFTIKRSSTPLTITGVAFSGLNVDITVSETVNVSDSLEVSYAYYGPGQAMPYTHAGVWGNVKMAGPSSVFFEGETLDAWLCAFKETVTV